jgi:hypothetical protein
MSRRLAVALLSNIIVQELALPPSLDDATDHYKGSSYDELWSYIRKVYSLRYYLSSYREHGAKPAILNWELLES